MVGTPVKTKRRREVREEAENMLSKEEPVAPKREAEADLYHERQERKRKKELKDPPKGRFVLVGNKKVVKKMKSNSGAEYSVYVGTKAEADKQGLKYEIE